MFPVVFLVALSLGGASGKVISCSVPTVQIPTQAEYTAGVPGKVAPILDVTFNKTRPSSDQAESVLRVCIAAVAKSVRIDGERRANAWYRQSATGSSADDEGPLPLRDGSRSLAFDPPTGRVRTWNEREGIRPSTRDDPRKGQYFTEYIEKKGLVEPYGKFAALDVVFQKAPSDAEAVAALITEIKRSVQAQPTRLTTTAYAKVGPRGDRVAQQQIHSSNGNIAVTYDPKTGQIRTLDGKILDSIR